MAHNYTKHSIPYTVYHVFFDPHVYVALGDPSEVQAEQADDEPAGPRIDQNSGELRGSQPKVFFGSSCVSSL